MSKLLSKRIGKTIIKQEGDGIPQSLKNIKIFLDKLK
jgi:hypothetical protein